jgi:hypothetical protein
MENMIFKKKKKLLNGFTIYDDEAYLLFWRCSSTINVFQGKMVKSRVKIKNEDEDEDKQSD